MTTDTTIEFDATLRDVIQASALFMVEAESNDFVSASTTRGNDGGPGDDWADMRDAWQAVRDRVLVCIALVDRLDAIDCDEERPILRMALAANELEVFTSAVIDASDMTYRMIGREVDERNDERDVNTVLALGQQLASLQGLLKRVRPGATQ